MRVMLAAIKRLDAAARVALGMLTLFYVLALLAPVIAPYSQSHQVDIVNMSNRPPSMDHPFGTDRFSRDVLSRTLYGARVSLTVATLAVLVSAFVGTFYGLAAAAIGGAIDTLLMRVLDALLAIPRVLLLIAILALWSPVPLGMLILLLGLTGWFGVSRLVRAEALTLRERDFVVAARSVGAGTGRIMWRHLLPNVLAPVTVATTLAVGNVIALEAGLSYLGIGVRPPSPSWGNIMLEGYEQRLRSWWLVVFPGIAIVTTVLAVNVVGERFREALDPRLRPPV